MNITEKIKEFLNGCGFEKKYNKKIPEASAVHSDEQELLGDIDDALNELSRCRKCFNLVTDSDLIDAVIYEELALTARYTYLIRQARENGISGRTVLK